MSYQGNNNNQGDYVPLTPDSTVGMTEQERRTAVNAAMTRASSATVTIEIDGITYKYTLEQIAEMNAILSFARHEGMFPTTTTTCSNARAVIHDYLRYIELSALRDSIPRERWNQERGIVERLVEITRDIRNRDKVAAYKSEEERVNAHVNNMMSGVSAESRLYDIVQHAVAFAVNNGSGQEAADLTGKSMANLLNGIRGVIQEMAGQGPRIIEGANVQAVLGDVFGIIENAMGDLATPLHSDIEDLGEHVEHMDGQIMHLNAIGQHVNAIDGHVNSLGTNINAMSTLLGSTNGNIATMTTQVNLLQTIVGMLPNMIAQSLQEMLPQALHNAIAPIVEVIEAQLHIAIPAASFQQQPTGLKKLIRDIKNFFRRN
ncbi:hypothetical protein F5Y11DRAFT_319767 [Daldinia sp. FL1419]|nr:hypothetical protein F5Y11DRAFT_319767 [Daldinia sp. FL1419]